MTDLIPKSIVAKALSSGDILGLLLGEEAYRCLPVSSPAPGNTDLAVLLAALYDEIGNLDRERLRHTYEEALCVALETERGVGPVAYAIVFEALRRARNRSSMGVSLDDLAKRLRKAISQHHDELERDLSGPGKEWPNGWLGELGRLSKLSQELGGPTFA